MVDTTHTIARGIAPSPHGEAGAPDFECLSRPSRRKAIVGGAKGVRFGMIKSLSVQNFRCFEHFSLSNFRPINLVVGRNAAGKTALLESIRLACAATPTAGWNLSVQRGQPAFILPNPTPEVFEAPWRPLFLNLDFANEIKTSFTDDTGITA